MEKKKKATANDLEKSENERKASNLLTLNDKERAHTFEDIEDEKWNYLAGAAKRKQMLSGVVSGLEHRDSRYPVCVVDYEGIRILIPAKEMFTEQWPGGTVPPEYIARINRSFGATIDFILLAVDVHSHAAIGSRRSAMQEQQKKYYDTGRIQQGILIACRVVYIGPNSMTVEAAGVDSVIPIEEIGWRWYQDISDVYAPGDLVTAKVMSINKDNETGNYHVGLSIKEATDGNPDLPALRRLVTDATYFGTVTGVNGGVIFIRLQAGVNAKTKAYFSNQQPAKYDTVCFQVRRIDETNCTALGVVTRIIKRYANTR